MQEAAGPSLKGRVICGSEVGYAGGRRFSLEEVITHLSEISGELALAGYPAIPFIITEGALFGRSESGSYQESVYTLNFSWSPRIPSPTPEEFSTALQAYAANLGSRLSQERVYVEFDGTTTILKKA